MLTFIAKGQISSRLMGAFLLAAVIPGLIISLLGVTFIKDQQNRSQAVQMNINAFKSTTTTAAYFPQLQELLKELYQDQYATTSPVLRAQVQGCIQKLQQLDTLFLQSAQQYKQKNILSDSSIMGQSLTLLTNNDPLTKLPIRQKIAVDQVLSQSWPGYLQAQEKLFTSIKTKRSASIANQELQQALQAGQLAAEDWQQVVAISEQLCREITQVGPAQTNPLILATILAFLSTMLVVTVIGYAVYLTITRPLHELSLLTERIAAGDTSARAQVTGKDEISQVARSMNTMLDHIVLLLREAQFQRDHLQARVEKLACDVSVVGEGNLRVHAEVTADAIGVMADSFNYMIEELGSLIVRVKLVAYEVDGSTSNVLTQMTQLVETGKREMEQIAGIEEEIHHMMKTSRQVSERSQILYTVARGARRDVQLGRESILHATNGMGRIHENVHATAAKVLTLEECSREINEIVEAISGLAHQTNRLALDAAIQAAMAGDDGKGFGAVASDIRRLAELSKDQAKMITRIVRNIREEIGAVTHSMQDTERETVEGTRLTREAGNALEALFAAVEHQAREIDSIHQIAARQLSASKSISSIMQRISASTLESNGKTEEASQHMARLARLVEQLRASVEAFKLRENQGYYIANSPNTHPDEDPDKPFTVSGVYRKIRAHEQSTFSSWMRDDIPLPPPLMAPIKRPDQLQSSINRLQKQYPFPQIPSTQNSQLSGSDWPLPINETGQMQEPMLPGGFPPTSEMTPTPNQFQPSGWHLPQPPEEEAISNQEQTSNP
ncbi:methyl-accepting chemotaxis protein [Tengunoibacter tsumagoiensis]|uniref:Methyl-accepting chemotaxis protein n=1 Tax=Tengunoibacter tsumagoiensis TaxID=2014871 RepID=A0A401ZU43_9CHLR|nr:methyl-accepting chemotaxis protein [Tengunoibacter tsumagoiensis]GCE10332.1 hypothetical protein KTT_01910 [Tengunoibacter tsumagoiensis]